ncbi:MAG: hypothetical protein KC503_36315 [Myxococcales bacterium]|nr:hypothetical protein [Myxococcales bacterium]
MLARTCVVLAAGLLASGCIPTSNEAAFTGDRSEIPCGSGAYPVCRGAYAGCILEENNYIRGTFPGSRKFLVTTKPGDWTIRILIFLDQQRAPGDLFEVNWFEPGCTDQYRYKLSDNSGTGGERVDIFEKAGRDKVFEVEQPVVESGDHLVEIFADATARFVVRAVVVKTEK